MLCNYLGGVSWSIAWVLNFLTACLASIHKKYLEGVYWNFSSHLKKSEAVTRPSGTPDNACLVVLITFLQRVVAVEGLKSSLREQLQPWLLSSSTRTPQNWRCPQSVCSLFFGVFVEKIDSTHGDKVYLFEYLIAGWRTYILPWTEQVWIISARCQAERKLFHRSESTCVCSDARIR